MSMHCLSSSFKGDIMYYQRPEFHLPSLFQVYTLPLLCTIIQQQMYFSTYSFSPAYKPGSRKLAKDDSQSQFTGVSLMASSPYIVYIFLFQISHLKCLIYYGLLPLFIFYRGITQIQCLGTYYCLEEHTPSNTHFLVWQKVLVFPVV